MPVGGIERMDLVARRDEHAPAADHRRTTLSIGAVQRVRRSAASSATIDAELGVATLLTVDVVATVLERNVDVHRVHRAPGGRRRGSVHDHASSAGSSGATYGSGLRFGC